MYPVFLIAITIVCVWVVTLTVISHMGGWAALASEYSTAAPFPGSRWNFECGQMRWFVSYNNCLTVGADPHGLYLWVFRLIRFAHPPLFIPWTDVSISSANILWFKQVKLRLGRERSIPFTVNERLAQKLKAAAGPSWPVDSAT
jgi:hypothetical protein